MTKTIVICVQGFYFASFDVDDETRTMVTLQPEIRSELGLGPTQFIHLGYYRRVSGSPSETVWVPNNMTVRDAYNLIIQVSYCFVQRQFN